MKSNRFWILLLCGVLLICIFIQIAASRGAGYEARIYVDGELIETIDLSVVVEPYSFLVEGYTGTNTIAVENKRIRVSESDCPDGSCIRQGWISGGITPIVCLPHKLVIELSAGAMPEVDAIAR